MKTLIKAAVMTFSMFLALPIPIKVWEEKARPLMPMFLPAVGALIGLLFAVAFYLLSFFNVPKAIMAAVMCSFPFVITGFIHIDGFMDVTDAVRSCRDISERRRILKDPNCGSFAVISCIILVLFQFALFLSLKETANLHALIGIPIVSRCLSAISVTQIKPMSTSQYSGNSTKAIKFCNTLIPAVVLAATLFLEYLFLGKYVLSCVAVGLGYLLSALYCVKALGGMSGDIAGYCLTVGEFSGILIYTLI